ncbi:MAG: 1-phosphofructokinase family hexose kinase, partial [Candidatus Kapaibacterium sp.]
RSSGNQYRFGMPGEPLADDVWQQILDRITTLKKKPEYIVGSGSLPPGVPDDFYNMLADIGKDIGAKVIIDTSGKPLKRAVESGVFLLKPNIRELRDLTGREIENEDEQESTAQELLKSGKCEAIVLSLGAAGVLFVTKSGHERLRAPSVSIKSKIGAGDSTVAGIIYGLIKENDLAKAVRMGIAAGAAAVMTPGSQLACKDDILRLYELIIKKRI